ncbi:MAG TPA: FG-GAP-like repeat-containing protein, partial [bacterium]|nr:FG-GAP-like repeat-containing protein [bacterium]
MLRISRTVNDCIYIVFITCMFLLLPTGTGANSVTEILPSPNSHQAPVDTDISVTLDETLDPASITTDNFLVNAGFRAVVPGGFTVDATAFTFYPGIDFLPGERVSGYVTSGIVSGGSAAVPYAFGFRAGVMTATAMLVDTGQSLGTGNSQDVTLGDIDGDGDLDALVANYYGNDELWWNDGNGYFTNSGIIIGSPNSERYLLADVDNDGDPDVINIPNWGNGTRIYLNDGFGNLTDSGQVLGVDGGSLCSGPKHPAS